MLPPKVVTADRLAPETIQAAYELIAEALRQDTVMLNVTLSEVTYDGKRVGDFEISIRLLD